MEKSDTMDNVYDFIADACCVYYDYLPQATGSEILDRLDALCDEIKRYCT